MILLDAALRHLEARGVVHVLRGGGGRGLRGLHGVEPLGRHLPQVFPAPLPDGAKDPAVDVEHGQCGNVKVGHGRGYLNDNEGGLGDSVKINCRGQQGSSFV